MKYLKRIGRFILITFISIFALGFILNMLYYFEIINNNIYNILKMILILGVLFINALILGKTSSKQGIIEGLKIGVIFLLVMIILKLITDSPFNERTFIYSIIIILTTYVGTFIGIKYK